MLRNAPYFRFAVAASITGRCLFARPSADIAAAEALRPTNFVDRGVGSLAGSLNAGRHRADIEHAPAVRQDTITLAFGTGVKDFDTIDRCGLCETADHRALGGIARITS